MGPGLQRGVPGRGPSHRGPHARTSSQVPLAHIGNLSDIRNVSDIMILSNIKNLSNVINLSDMRNGSNIMILSNIKNLSNVMNLSDNRIYISTYIMYISLAQIKLKILRYYFTFFLISSTLRSSDVPKPKNTMCACADFFMERSQ